MAKVLKEIKIIREIPSSIRTVDFVCRLYPDGLSRRLIYELI
jgi:hypothetical protein